MILVDSSAWIEYYRRDGEEEVRDLVFSAIRDHRAATNGTIKVEIVAYATREADSRNVWSDLSGCHWLELTVPVFELAVEMGRKLRTFGVTVPATDLIIASSARLADAELLHFDGHFELIAEHLPLVTLGPLEPPAREASDEAHTSQSDARRVGQDGQDGPSAGGAARGSA